jgi:uncharacterized membrane protein YhaH (DUF805 family)
VPDLLRLWFGVSLPVDRRRYLLSGIVLMITKFAGDDALVRLLTGHSWSPLQYFSPSLDRYGYSPGSGQDVGTLSLAMAVWALPFLWIGASMTLRRLLDARLSPWFVLLFFVPWLNWVLMVVLCVVPSRRREKLPAEARAAAPRLTAAMLGVGGGIAVGAVSLGLHVLLLKSYNAFVFLGTPFVMGAVAGYVYNRRGQREKTATLGALTVVVAALAMLLFALEGVVCIAMALPLALPLGALGAVVGRLIAAEHRESSPAALALVLALSPLATLEKPPLREVLSSIEIDAPPAQVWPHVVAFADLDEPPRWFFRLGIAYPQRARLSGSGVGAVRRCEFSTGAFVEPITAWEEPSRLAFDVQSQPPPLHEWSPYRKVHAQHLLDTLRSRRGEFRLIALPGGRTRLEGRTFYELSMAPQAYWSVFSDQLIHQIHDRVLRHIRAEVEAGR